jgi:hypothetical protein
MPVTLGRQQRLLALSLKLNSCLCWCFVSAILEALQMYEAWSCLFKMGVVIMRTKVTDGKTSRDCGGRKFEPTFMLDSVLLADRVKVLEELGSVIEELQP